MNSGTSETTRTTPDEHPRPDVSIIIPNYNTRDLLCRCLTSIFHALPSHSCEVIVVDDASVDDSAEMVRTAFPRVKLMVNEKNQGYARSNNRAIASSRGRYVYLLNSDAELLPGAVDELVDFLETHRVAGAAGSLLYNADGTLQASVKSLPSVRSGLFGKRSLLARWLPRSRFVRNELLQWKAEAGEPFQAGYVSSASLMLPREVIDEVGELDTRLWYFIDADYCKRVWNLGREVYCVPRAKAIHREHRGGTLAGPRQRFRSLVSFHYGAHLFFRKHGRKSWYHPSYALVTAGLALRFLVSLGVQLVRETTGNDRRTYDEAPFHSASE